MAYCICPNLYRFVADPPENWHLNVKKIAKNLQLAIFWKIMIFVAIFLTASFWQFVDIEMAIFHRVRYRQCKFCVMCDLTRRVGSVDVELVSFPLFCMRFSKKMKVDLICEGSSVA